MKWRASKIYINDYSEDAKSGLDLLKDLYDLSVGNTSNLTGHASLNERVSNMQNLEIFFHANTAPKAYANNWTPLANGENQCYNGTIHGEGYYIDGLKSSFIGHLCGHVYNLGVNGSFTSAGLADTGDGYVENCWVKTTGTPSSGVKAVFGDPTATNWVQVNNCYYAAPEGSDYQSGLAVRKDSRAFYNGEVAYDLNGYYLKERYNRQAAEADKINTYGYVENRYHNNNNDIDFLYSNGTIPTDDDPRLTTDAQGNYYYAPIWPDDYLFFGQTLTYGYQYPETGTHQAVPSHLTKAGTANTLNIVSSSNRVYRTPAYFGDKTMGIFHFNPYAVIAAKSADSQHEAYPGMTAVDFTAHNDQSYTKTENNLPCGANRAKGTLLGYGTHTAFALAELCYKNLISDGYKAKVACDNHAVTQAFEKIVETNILLSGLGFESGGLAAAHAIHDGITIIHEIHANNFHGEVVAFGTICQLILENSPEDELYEVLDFCVAAAFLAKP